MMFKPGNILRHKSSLSMWLIIDNKELEDREKPNSSFHDYWGQTSQIEAYCLYSGPKADWWKAGQNDTWFIDNDRNKETNYFSAQWEAIDIIEDIK